MSSSLTITRSRSSGNLSGGLSQETITRGNAPPTVNQASIFALSPELEDSGVIDYKTSSGAKMYNQAVKKLSENQFDCNAAGLKIFMTHLRAKYHIMGWECILLIPTDHTDPHNNLINMVYRHGEITLEQVTEHARTYMHGINRSAEDASQMFHFLMVSLTPEGSSKIAVWYHELMDEGLGNGPILLRVIIRESDMDTNASERHLRQKIRTLDTYIPSIDHDIIKFNIYVKEIVNELAANGHTTSDLI